MNWILIKMLEYRIRKVEKYSKTLDSSIVRSAYDVMIKNYKNTVMFLNAERRK